MNTRWDSADIYTKALVFAFHNIGSYAMPRPHPKKIYHNRKAGVTVVLWKDGTKTIVRKSETDPDDLYAAYCIALTKKLYGTNSAIKRDLDRCIVIQESKKSNVVKSSELLYDKPLD